LAAARDKKPKQPQPGPYIFTSKASAQTVKALIVQTNRMAGYTLDSDKEFELRFSMPAQLPFIYSMFMISGVCKGMTSKKVWSYSLAELNGVTKITVRPVWEYPDEDCQTQTHEFIWSQQEEIGAFQAMLDKAPISPATAPSSAPTSTTDQQQSVKQHAACLELAKANPSIICK
jgi:hypothetical protein